MKTLHGYLTRQVLVSLGMSVLVFTFILLLGNLLREILTLLVNQQASLFLVLKAVGLLIPYVWVFALPMGLLTATLLTMGRFSADQELTAIRANGISLLSFITPVLLLSVAMSLLCALFNLELGPRCRTAYKQMIYEITSEKAMALLPENVFIREFPPYIVYIGEKDGDTLRNVFIYKINEEKQLQESIRAARGELEMTPEEQAISITLFDAWVVTETGGGTGQPRPVWLEQTPSIKLGTKGAIPQKRRVKLGDMTLLQLLEEKQDLESTVHRPMKKKSQELRLTTPIDVQIHSQISFSFACIGFTLIGIPLGIRAHRRETMAGAAIAILLVLLYYSFIILGQSLESKPELAPQFIVWIPNFLFQLIGGWLIFRANRGSW